MMNKAIIIPTVRVNPDRDQQQKDIFDALHQVEGKSVSEKVRNLLYLGSQQLLKKEQKADEPVEKPSFNKPANSIEVEQQDDIFDLGL